MGQGVKPRCWRCTTAGARWLVTACLPTEKHQLSLSSPTNLSSRWTRLCCGQATILQIQIVPKLAAQIWQFLHFKGCPPTLPSPPLIHLLILSHQWLLQLKILQRMTAQVHRAAAAAATNPSDSTNKRMCFASAPLPPPPPSAPRPSSCPSSVQGPSSNVSKEVTARTPARTLGFPLSRRCKETLSSAHLSRAPCRGFRIGNLVLNSYALSMLV